MASPSSQGNARLDIDLQSIRIVQAIEATGSITGASRVLGLSQPAISQHLQRAETRLGMPLIVRTGRTVRLSDAGMVLAGIAPVITEALDAASQELSGLASLRAGQVKLAGFPSASSTLLPTVLSKLKRTRPGLSVSYTEAEPADATQMVLDGDVDIAVVARYPSDPVGADSLENRGLSLIPLFVDQMLLILPASHHLAEEKVVDLIALQDDEWVAGCPKCRGHVVAACQEVGFEPQISFETDNFSAVLGLVSRGLGVAILPRLALGTAALPPGAVVRRTEPQGTREIQLLVASGALGVLPVRTTIAALTALDGAPWKLARPHQVPALR